MSRSGTVGLALLLAFFGVPAAAGSEAPSPLAQLAALRADDAAVLAVGYRLAASAGDLCSVRRRTIGVQVHDLAQYAPGYRAAARTLFARADLPAVLAVAQDGPAARAGVRSGDAVVAVNGARVAGEPAAGSFARADAVGAAIDAAAAAGPVSLTLERDGLGVERRIVPADACATRFQVRAAAEARAGANGELVEVTTGLLRIVRSHDELAVVLAHELAHNILRHRQRLNAAGIDWRDRRRGGRSARLRRETEIEADRLAVYVIDRAGYDTAAVLTFWERMARARDRAEPVLHPGDGLRLAILTAELRRLAALKVAGERPRPVPFPSER